jgi:cation diffusion facilitator CzcD-associated flavoprotein CzcO
MSERGGHPGTPTAGAWLAPRGHDKGMSTAENRSVCVIGAGVSGLFAARRLIEEGLPVGVVEQRPDLGGLWNRDPRYGGAYRSAHLISSKHTTELADFPMPAEFPDFPSHAQVLTYLRGFADRHGLATHISFGRRVSSAVPLPQGGWHVGLDDGSEHDYAALVIANGHHWDPAPPPVDAAGFDGMTFHSAGYDTPDCLAGRKVIVVGLGNTACDVAVDAVYAGAAVTMSVRGGNHLIPKYLLGRPTDRLSKDLPSARLTAKLPPAVKAALDERMIRTLAGNPERFGLPRPRGRLYERQPLVNSLLMYHLGHGDIRIKPPVRQVRNSSVLFEDGSEEKAEVIVWCNGYQVSMPFLDVRAHLAGDQRGRPRLWLNMFHPTRDDVVVAGMVDPLGSWTALDVQAQLAARHLRTVLSGGDRVPPLRSGADVTAPRLGTGPDRDWLFRGHAYTGTLREHLSRLPAP